MSRPILDRPVHAWRALGREQRLAALASLGLFVSMLLPWYSKTDTFVEHNAAKASQASLSAFQAFSFVEAAVLLVSAGVLGMLFARAEGRDFHLPGGDGTIVMIAGGWAALLIFYRLLAKPGLSGNERITATVGVQWGIFIALLLALGLLYTGALIRAAERGQPPVSRPGTRERERDPEREETVRGPVRQADAGSRGAAVEEQVAAISPVPARPRRVTPAPGSAPAPGDRRSARGRPRYPPAPSEQMSFEDKPPSGE
jgi:hypothetical protein